MLYPNFETTRAAIVSGSSRSCRMAQSWKRIRSLYFTHLRGSCLDRFISSHFRYYMKPRKSSPSFSTFFHISTMHFPVLIFAAALSTAIAKVLARTSLELGSAGDPYGSNDESDVFQDLTSSDSLVDSDDLTNGASCGTSVSDQIDPDQIDSDRIDARSELNGFEVIGSTVARSNVQRQIVSDTTAPLPKPDCGDKINILCCLLGLRHGTGHLCVPCMFQSPFSVLHLPQKSARSIFLSMCFFAVFETNEFSESGR